MTQQQAATAAAEPTSRFVEINRLRLHYLDWGGDQRHRYLVLLHGGAAHAHWWDAVAPLLTRAGRVLVLDFRGHGRSAWTHPSDYGPSAYLQDVIGLVSGLGRPVVLAGHSMGGAVAQWLAAAHPEMLEALVIIDAPAGPPPLFLRLKWRWRRRARGRERPELDSADAIARRFRLSPPETYLSAEALARLALSGAEQLPNGRWAFRFDPQTRAWRRRGRYLPPPRLSRITAPTLILRGAESKLMSARAAARMHRGIRRSVYKQIPRAFHHVPLDNPEDTAAAILEFLASLPKSRPKQSPEPVASILSPAGGETSLSPTPVAGDD